MPVIGPCLFSSAIITRSMLCRVMTCVSQAKQLQVPLDPRSVAQGLMRCIQADSQQDERPPQGTWMCNQRNVS